VKGETMIKYLKLQNIGPAPIMEMDFGERLNVMTGDNGLGKSFLLDVAWWAMTRKWPAEINEKLTSGKMARPTFEGDAGIEFIFSGFTKDERSVSVFDKDIQSWTSRGVGRPSNPGLVLYAMSDGSFAVWDPIKNYWKNDSNDTNRPAAYVFSSKEVWDGLVDKNGNWLCNGLIRDWAGWQKEHGETFELLKKVLESLSSDENEKLIPGELTRVSLDDVRDIPTIKMPYGQEVPVIHASSGIRRVIALAYFLVWAWDEHEKAAKLTGKSLTPQITFLIDEIESHLHPSWQRVIVPSLLSVVTDLSQNAKIQIITATHSPIILTSIETIFDESKDAWFDIDYQQKDDGSFDVVLQKRRFIKRGNVCNWLTSEAFDLKSSRSLDAEKVIEDVDEAMKKESFNKEDAEKFYKELKNILGETDEFWIGWNYFLEKKGWK
jgi:predicted ATPase